ncbi:hypothetical protein JHK82_038388 [Glycine max]|nr:hypothetical protein JHK85_039134 [Glycine max]KAG4979095.1 hypothetical protein JHK86_038569 [Glycine max]KAG5115119.1 hypothetical protein JHK82_038388 [Glycine max]KAG5132392.1 hypothetical protein JHK84_038789 [Glycine max]
MLAIGGHGTSIRRSSTCTALLIELEVLQCVNEVLSLCSVLGLDFGQTVGDVHPSLHGTQVEQSTNISNSTLEGLEQAILKLKIERKTRISEGDFFALKDVVAKLFELWNLMDSSKEERNCFMKITSIVETSESEITERSVISTEMIEKASAEVDRLAKLKASRMKELVFKKRSELEEICRLTHIEPDPSTVAEKASALIDSAIVDNLINKTLAWEDEKKTYFLYEGARFEVL